MNIDDITVKGVLCFVPSNTDVDNVERSLGLTFPTGYREYVTRFGAGALGSLVRIYVPSRILDEYVQFQDRMRDYWFWVETEDILSQAIAMECIPIGDSVGGEDIVFHPSRPDRIYVLAHDQDLAFDAGGDLMTAVDWLCNSGVIVEPDPECSTVFETDAHFYKVK